ncbi:GumC family protein [Sphingomonas profundi]|uniref:GumC family protein n=1 Tax=Alterirhizorhabdus profundi TaxID=2681549 RepID=UPI0012E8CB85|nr:polysaccharide biosynthesis tyrosine autokinase [Sphingomonas profundi]
MTVNNPVELYQSRSASRALVPVTPPAAAAPADRLDLRAFLTTLRRRLKLVIAVALAVFALVMLYTLRKQPIYSAAAQVALNTTIERVAPTGSDRSDPGAVPNDTVAETETQVLSSREMAAKVDDALKLERDPAFNPLLDDRPGLRARVARALGLSGAESGPPTAAEHREAVLDRLQGGLTVTRIGTSLAFAILFSTEQPDLAARIANEYARRYTLGQLDSKQRLNRETRIFLARRLDELRAQANADNERVQRYRVASNLLSTSGASLTEQEISAYNQAVSEARAQAVEDKARLDTARAQLRGGSTGDDVGEALGSGVVSALRSRQADAAAQLANLRARYGPRHPDVLKAQSELGEIDGTIEAEIKRVISNLDAKARVSRERLGSIAGSLAGARGTLAQNNRAMVTLDDLQRRAEASQALYESYLNRYKETSAQEGAERPDARILSLAEVPDEPSSPNVPLHALIGAVLGGGLGILAALVAEGMFQGLTTGEEVEGRLRVRYLTGIPLLASVAKAAPAPIAAVVQMPQSGFAEAFRTLRTALPYAVPGHVQVIAITSALPQEGKTTLSICLARVAAMAGEKVLLVDFDLRRRGTSVALGGSRSDGPGLAEVLRGEATPDEAIGVDEASGAHVLLVPRAVADGGDLVQAEGVDRLIDALKARYGLILFDAPPVLPIAYGRLVAAKADAALLVVRWLRTADHAVRAALRLLPPNHVRLAGIVLTQIDMRKQQRFGHGDAASYYDQYKEYYA